jgi:bacteriocin-like protein
METINERNLVISEFQDQVIELDDNELDSISGGVVGGVAGGIIGYAGAVYANQNRGLGTLGGIWLGGRIGAAVGTFFGPGPGTAIGASLATPEA